jgi:hypothetical protein
MADEQAIEKPNWNEQHVQARDMLFDWLATAENAVFNMGFEQGFKAGWEAHVEHMTRVFAEQAAARPSTAAPTPPAAPARKMPTKLDQPTAKELVLQVITERPGLRGVDIVKELNKGVTPVAERSVRTALHRLKRARKIKVLRSGWYTVEAAANVL